MEEKEIMVAFKEVDYHVCIQVEYKGIDAIITATTGNARLSFEPNEYGGIDIRQSGEQLEEGLINQIALAIGKALE